MLSQVSCCRSKLIGSSYCVDCLHKRIWALCDLANSALSLQLRNLLYPVIQVIGLNSCYWLCVAWHKPALVIAVDLDSGASSDPPIVSSSKHLTVLYTDPYQHRKGCAPPDKPMFGANRPYLSFPPFVTYCTLNATGSWILLYSGLKRVQGRCKGQHSASLANRSSFFTQIK
jgi:hypothetical protein